MEINSQRVADEWFSAEIGRDYPPTPTASRSSTPPYTYYFPVIYKGASAKFSVGGIGTRREVLQIVPPGLQIDAYIWDTLPNLNSTIQMVRACTYYRDRTQLSKGGATFKAAWYGTWKAQVNPATGLTHLCWDPVSQQIAKILLSPHCPYGATKPCLDVESDTIPNTGESEFRALVRAHPEWVWLVSNEPDNAGQDGIIEVMPISDGETVWQIHPGGPRGYAQFYKTVYDVVAQESGITPKLVFCQASFAHGRHGSMGLNYCNEAYAYLRALGMGPTHIYALATHQYLHETVTIGSNRYGGGRLLDGTTKPIAGDNRSVLEHGLAHWQRDLQAFEAWALAQGMGDKPLWLTEYGTLAGWCYQADQLEDMENGGLACPSADNGQHTYPFYGRNSSEGLWGLQMGQMAYIKRNDNQWNAAWWFVSTMGWGTGDCFQSGWLWMADYDCEAASWRANNLSRAGETHFQTLNCLYNNRCSPVEREHERAGTTPSGEPYCKVGIGGCTLPNNR